MSPRHLITIDGPAGAGKSTAARGLAKALGWTYLDSGAFYRLVAWQVLRRGVNPDEEAAVAGLLPQLAPEPGEDAHGFFLEVEGLRLGRELRTPEVSEQASRVARLPAVRRWVTERLRLLARGRKVVAEGRDLGTVVFPEADLKLYLDADLPVRAARRQREQAAGGSGGGLQETLEALAARDAQDQSRPEAPLRIPEGAVILDTTHLSPEEVVAHCLALTARRLRPDSQASGEGAPGPEGTAGGGLSAPDEHMSPLTSRPCEGGTFFMIDLDNKEETLHHPPGEVEIQNRESEPSGPMMHAEAAAMSAPATEPPSPSSPAPEAAAGGEEEEEVTMSELYEESLRRVQEGEVVRGRIVSLTKDYVMVDIGYKSEGQIPISEFTTPDGEVTAKVGDQVEALLESREDEEGPLLLSKTKASRLKVWEEISYAYHNEGVVEGTITAKVKGGFSVDLGGITAFLPGSQVDLVPVRNPDSLIGQRLTFHVLKFNRKRRNVVLSRRTLLEKAKNEAKATLLATLEEGKVVEGVVKNITDYGVFVDLGGLDGLLHVTDISYGRIRHPGDLFKVGDTITVKVLSFDKDKERISLGLKQLHPDPWTMVQERYPVGAIVTGKVVSLTDYGAFVELEPGVEGLIHISEMSWTRKIRHPSQVLSAGDVVEVKILEVEPQRKRISLSLRQVEPNPWEVIGDKYPVGSVIEGKIKNITDFGIFIGIDEGIDGLVHISDISWTKRFKHPSEIFKKGQTVQAKVLAIDKENERFSLSIKELTPNPWETIDQRYPVGAVVSGPITNITDFGLFVEIEEGIEGLVHISEYSRDKEKTASLKVGDLIRAKVIHCSPQERRIGLSIRRLEAEEEQRTYRDYLKGSQEATTSLGDLLRESLGESEARKNGPK